MNHSKQTITVIFLSLNLVTIYIFYFTTATSVKTAEPATVLNTGVANMALRFDAHQHTVPDMCTKSGAHMFGGTAPNATFGRAPAVRAATTP